MTRGTRVLSRIRKRVTYANVMSTLAVFIALGGSSYAAFAINGDSIKNRSIRASKIRKNTLTGAEIRESSLGRVNRAKQADTLDGVTASELKIKCPADTFPEADVCVERTRATRGCVHGAVQHLLDGRHARWPRVGVCRPTANLSQRSSAVPLADRRGAHVERLSVGVHPGQLDVLYVTDRVGSVALTPDTGAGAKAFRCVTDPLN